MELFPGTRKASKYDPKDFISIMPKIVVTNILDRLPLQDAVRTGILSRDWRYKWTTLGQLLFDKSFFEYLLKAKHENSYRIIISRLLLHLKGTITKFVLYVENMSKLEDGDINHWILFLSTKGITDLTLWKRKGTLLKLPTHLFSCLELKHLKLRYCSFDPSASFHGFPNLLTLELTMVLFRSSNCGEFITCCPLLEILNLRRVLQPFNTNTFLLDILKPTEIAKFENLKILSVSLCNLDNMMITSPSSIFELVGLLPKLQELHLDFTMFEFTQGAAKEGSLTSFPCLTALTLSKIDLGNGILLSCAFELIRCSPNLQTLEITTFKQNADLPPAIPEVEYNTMGPLQLRRVVFRDLKGLENEVCLIKYLLACSPFLEKIVICPRPSLASGEKLFMRKLLKLHRASSVAEIDLR